MAARYVKVHTHMHMLMHMQTHAHGKLCRRLCLMSRGVAQIKTWDEKRKEEKKLLLKLATDMRRDGAQTAPRRKNLVNAHLQPSRPTHITT